MLKRVIVIAAVLGMGLTLGACPPQSGQPDPEIEDLKSWAPETSEWVMQAHLWFPYLRQMSADFCAVVDQVKDVEGVDLAPELINRCGGGGDPPAVPEEPCGFGDC